MDPTRKWPCTKNSQATCHDIEAYKMLIKRFKCKISFFDFGPHLKNLLKKHILPECNQTVLREAMGIFVGTKMKNCLSTSVCETTKFSLSLQEYEMPKDSAPTFSISFQDPEIENHHTRISYDVLSLIGEIGGVLGLTLGLSVFSFVGSCISIFQSIKNRGHSMSTQAKFGPFVTTYPPQRRQSLP